MKQLRLLLIVFITLFLVLSFCACGSDTEEESQETAAEITEEMIRDYGKNGDEAESRVSEDLEKLSSIDEDKGARWGKIMKLWSSPDLGKPLNYDVLPDGLPETNELCIVVLGFQLEADGTMKEELIGRLTTALDSANKYPNAYVLCTGGGTALENETVTEADQMANWLKEKGVDEKRIIVENQSLSTAQNAKYSYDILEKDYPQITKLAIVSSDYHIAAGTI